MRLQIDLVQSDIEGWGNAGVAVLREACVDTVVMNPPFGTRKKGADVAFLHAAFRVRRPPAFPPLVHPFLLMNLLRRLDRSLG